MIPESLRILCQLLTPDERRQARNLTLIMIAGTVLEAAGVGLVLPVVAIITSSDPAADYQFLASPLRALGDPPQRTLVIGTLVAMVTVSLVKVGVLSAVQRAQFRFAFGLQSSLSQRLFRTYMMQPWPFHLRRNSAELIHNVSAATNLLTFNTTLPVITATGELLVGLSICAVLLASEPVGTLAIGAALGSGAWLFHRLTRSRVAEWGRMRQEHEAQRMRHLQQGIGGIKDIAVLGRQDHFLKAVRQHSDASFGALERQLVLQQMPRLWVEFFAVSGMVGLAAAMVLAGRSVATVGPTLGLFAAAAFRLMPAVNRVMNAAQALRFGEATARVLRDEMALGIPTDSGATSGRARFRSALELRELGFTYPGNGEATLEGVNLRVAKGEVVGIIGKSGAGKSTLIDLVLGLLEPTGGAVAVDGRDIRADIGTWRSTIGYVPQSIYLTDDTLRRNVALGLEDDEIDSVAVDRAIAGSQLGGLVSSLPEKLDTIVGERGVRLSGGQRQRVGIARALYRDPDLLVLDEATSALDEATEAAFIEAVRELRGSRTILIVAHRMTTLRDCDRIYRIEGGRVEEVFSPSASGQPENSVTSPNPTGIADGRSDPSAAK
jgi:ABC-type multidrug transport system fused ATPase/permease subunit